MDGNIREYAKIGLAHFMFWPECMRSTCVMIESLPKLLQRQDIDVIDCCLPYDEGARRKLVPALRNCGKQLGYAIHPFPLDKISLGSVMEHEQGLARLVIRDQIEAAARIGASTFTIASGGDPGQEQRAAAKNVFRNFCGWLCDEVADHNIMVLLEPFDRSFARKFLFGPTAECVELIESLKPHVNNLRIQLDIAHVRLSGERFEQAVQTCGKLLGHVHLGNCLMRDCNDPFFGDRHPPAGYPGGEIDVDGWARALRCLLEAGYLNKRVRPTLVIEAQPFPGLTPEQTIEDQLSRLDRAWREA